MMIHVDSRSRERASLHVFLRNLFRCCKPTEQRLLRSRNSLPFRIKVQMQSVPVGTERKELNLPSTLDFTDSTRKAGTVSGITCNRNRNSMEHWQVNNIFTPVIPGGGVFSCKWDRIAQDHLTGDKTGSRTGEYHLALWR